MSAIVRLTWPEVWVSVGIGLIRRIMNVMNGVGPTNGSRGPCDEGAWEPDLFACPSEMSVAKFMGQFWAGSIGDYYAPDVASNIEVRVVRRESADLFLRPDDDLNSIYVSVCIKSLPECHLRGWIYGYEAMPPGAEWDRFEGEGGEYFGKRVDVSQLHPMTSLRSMSPQLLATKLAKDMAKEESEKREDKYIGWL